MRSVFKGKIQKYNQVLPLAEYLRPFVGDKKEVKIVDIGCGPFAITGQILEGVKVEIHHCDQRDFHEEWERHDTKPLFPIEVQNMEKLTYEDNSFDVVVCINALDHTKDAPASVKEMIRVCKPGGWVYIDCALDQLSTTGGWHYWDAKEDGRFVGRKEYVFDLKDFGFQIKYIDNHGPRRYNNIIATLQKNALNNNSK